MSEEIARRLEEAASAHGHAVASGADLAHVTASVIGGARRRRRVTGLVTAAVAMAGIVLVAGGSVVALSAWGEDRQAPATQSSTPSAEPTLGAAPDPAAVVPDPAKPVGKDGIADYPMPAPSRGEGFPSAYVMEDWVWDYVGEGWSLESYSLRLDYLDETPPVLPAAVVYLVSPDDAAFELVVLAGEQSNGLRVASWREDARSAMVWWESRGDVPSDAAVLDLTTGALDPLDFTMPGNVHSTSETPIAIAADGTELWNATAPGIYRWYYRWSEADGWTVAAVNDLPGVGTAAGFNFLGRAVEAPTYARADGTAVALGRTDSDGTTWEETIIELAVYDLAADVVTRTTPTLDLTDYSFVGWRSSEALDFFAYDDEGHAVLPVAVSVGGAPAQGLAPAKFVDETLGTVGLSAVVGFGEATAVGVLYRACHC